MPGLGDAFVGGLSPEDWMLGGEAPPQNPPDQPWPSWLQKAQDLNNRDVAAYQNGVSDPAQQELASGFGGGGIAGRTRAVTGVAGKAAPPMMPQVAERYPAVGPPITKVETDKAGNIVNTFPSKQLTPEAEQVAKMRQAAQKDITAGNYDPYFDPAQRFDVNPANYPAIESTLDIRKVKPETQAKYEDIARSPEATQRLGEAFRQGMLQKEGAGNWYQMGQLENEFIKEYGPQVGPRMFKERFADAMAATTGGADPTSNLMMAHYGNYLKARGEPLPEASHQYPFPVGGRYAGSNMGQYEKMIMQGGGIDRTVNPKRYNFAANFTGDRPGVTIDEQMMGLFEPKMQMPPAGSYGHFQGALADLAKKQGVDPRYYQEVAWAGRKAGESGNYKAQPMIATVNEAIERTHRITGMPREEIVRRGLVRGEIPLYGLGGMLGAAAVGDQFQEQ